MKYLLPLLLILGCANYICPADWDPVCGVDGNTYSNICYADRQNVEIDYAGVCE